MGAFKYYVIKEVGGWGQKIAIFDDLQYCKYNTKYNSFIDFMESHFFESENS